MNFNEILQRGREFQNNEFLFNIQELLKIIADQQQQIITLMKENQKKTIAETKTKK